MKKVLILRPDLRPVSQTCWLVMQGHRCLSWGYWQTDDVVPEIWSGIASAILLIPGSDVVLRAFEINSKTLPPLSWLAENKMAGDPEALHWSVVHRDADSVSVAGCDRALLTGLLNRYAQAGLTISRIVPDVLLLPYSGDETRVYRCEGQRLCRYGKWEGFIAEEGWFSDVKAYLNSEQLVCVDDFSADLPGLIEYLTPELRKHRVNLLRGLPGWHPAKKYLQSVNKIAPWVLIAGLCVQLLQPLVALIAERHATQTIVESQRQVWSRFYDTPAPENVAEVFLAGKQGGKHTISWLMRTLDEAMVSAGVSSPASIRVDYSQGRIEMDFMENQRVQVEAFMTGIRQVLSFTEMPAITNSHVITITAELDESVVKKD